MDKYSFKRDLAMSRSGLDALPPRTYEQQQRTAELLVAQYHREVDEGRGIPGSVVPAPVYDRFGIGKSGAVVYGRQMVVYVVPIDEHNNNKLLGSVADDDIRKYANANLTDRSVIESIVNSCQWLSLSTLSNVQTVISGYDYEHHTITLNRNGVIGFSESTDWKKILQQAHGAIGKPKRFAIFATYPHYLENIEVSDLLSKELNGEAAN
jgi:hypothetical protein